MAGKSSRSGNWAPNSPATRYKASGKNREFYTFENAPGIGNYATGGTIIDGGDGYIYHIFTGNGTFTVNRPSAVIDSVDYLIVAGGGGGGGLSQSGGGGGGGMLFGNTPVSTAPGVYPVQVGGGGPGGSNPIPSGNNGTPSYFGPGAPGTLIAAGGGGGATPSGILPTRSGASGGSGGGGSIGPATPAPGPGGAGNTPATIPRQGYFGGSNPLNSSLLGGAGGGGAGGVGEAGSGPPALGGLGGPARIAPEFPSTILRRAIPAPLLPNWEPLVGPGGYAAGGNGGPRAPARTSPSNSGYGGVGGSPALVATGGSGIVCVRYKKNAPYSRATGGIVEPSTDPSNGHPGVWRHIFTSPGTFEVTDPTLQWVDYLAVGGGGGGGNGGSPTPQLIGGGGGGAGGFVSSIQVSTTTPTTIPEAYPWNPGYSVEVGEQYPVGIGTYPIGIGTGGNAGTTGSNTTIGNPGPFQIISYGGGGGGSASNGTAGASGGGASKFTPTGTTYTGGTATPTPFIQGNPGGPMPGSPLTVSGGAGGGGAGGGGTQGNVPSTPGGEGWYSVLSPSAYGTPGPAAGYRYFAGGGGGGWGNTTVGGNGGSGGGGAGGAPPGSTTGTPGTTNTGGGGGGGGPGSAAGGTGGPGIVIIQYPE